MTYMNLKFIEEAFHKANPLKVRCHRLERWTGSLEKEPQLLQRT